MCMIAVNDPAHRGVIAQALGVFNILIPCEPTEHRLSQHSNECMPCILAGAGVSETGRLPGVVNIIPQSQDVRSRPRFASLMLSVSFPA